MHMFPGYRIVAVGGVLLALLLSTGGWVFTQAAGRGETLQILTYDNLVRFVLQEERASILRVEVFDPSGRRLYDSGLSLGSVLDWPLVTSDGERVAHGVYLYVVSAWDSQGELLKSKVGKLALVPGGVSLGQALLAPGSQERMLADVGQKQVRAQAVDVDHSTESWAFGQVGIGTANLQALLDIAPGTTTADAFRINTTDNRNAFQIKIIGHTGGDSHVQFVTDQQNSRFSLIASTADDQAPRFQAIGPQDTTANPGTLIFDYGSMLNDLPNAELKIRHYSSTGSPTIKTMARFIGRSRVVFPVAKVGIGESNPSAALEVKAGTSNLLVLKNSSGNTVMKVQNDGDVFADGSYNCGLASGCFNSGQGADVAERIDASEPLEPGDVVEIDPENPGKFRKAREAMSHRVAGVISTAPAITLGNNFDPEADRWEDSRPLLALAGRVPVKAVAKFGAIEVGDLLVASPIPGYAMKCPNTLECVGAVIGKALEPLPEGAGLILIQVTLR